MSHVAPLSWLLITLTIMRHHKTSQLSRSCSSTIRYWSIFSFKQWWNCYQVSSLSSFNISDPQNVSVTAIIHQNLNNTEWQLSSKHVSMWRFALSPRDPLWLKTLRLPDVQITLVSWLHWDNDRVVIDRSWLSLFADYIALPLGPGLSLVHVITWPGHWTLIGLSHSADLFVAWAKALIGLVTKILLQLKSDSVNKNNYNTKYFSFCSLSNLTSPETVATRAVSRWSEEWNISK